MLTLRRKKSNALAAFFSTLFRRTLVKIQPLGNRILVLPDEAMDKSKGGILLPDGAKEKPQRGRVVAVGLGTVDDPMKVEVGQSVLYAKYTGNEIVIDDKKHLIMEDTEVLAIVS